MKEEYLKHIEKENILTNYKGISKKLKAYLPKDMWRLWKLYLRGANFWEIKKSLKLTKRENVFLSLIRLGEYLAFFKIEVLGWDIKLLLNKLKQWRRK